MKAVGSRILALSRWALPPVVLIAVFSQLDWQALSSAISNVDVTLLISGVLSFQFINLIGAFRWRYQLKQHIPSAPRYFQLLRHYWIGMAVGFFMPASIGWDVYRITYAVRQMGRSFVHALVIFMEKMAALTTCILILTLSYPVLTFDRSLPFLDAMRLPILFAGLSAIVLIVAILFTLPHHKIVGWLERGTGKVLRRLGKSFAGSEDGEDSDDPIGPQESHGQIPSQTRTMVMVVVFSLLIQGFSALAAQLFFTALGIEIPYVANLFATSVFFIVFVLPISFGGIGVREVAFIMVYGLFGIEPETAVLVSLFQFSAILVSNAIGAALIWGTRSAT